MNPTSSSVRCFRWVALAALILAPRLARADASESDMAQARELLREGIDLRGKGDAAAAVDKLKAANALAHTPITGFELGKTYLALGKLVEAREAFLSSAHMPAQSGETSRSATARSQSESLAEQLRSRIPSLRIRVTGVALDSVALTVDGALVPTGALEAPRFVNPGNHVVVARSSAGGETETRVDLKEGESRDVELKIVLTGGHEAPPTPANAPPPASATSPTMQTPAGNVFAEAPPARSHVLEWALIGAGAAIGIAGGVLMGVAAGQSSDAENRHDKSASDAASTLWTVGLVGAIAGGASVIGGATILLLPSHAGTSTAGSSFWVTAATNGVLLGGTW